MFGAAFTLRLADVVRNDKGEAVAASPLVLRDYMATPIDLLGVEELDLWIRQRHMQVVELSCASLSKETRLEVLVGAAKSVSSMSWHDAQGIRLMSCVDGMTMIARAAFRRNHPELTRESIRELLCYPPNWREVLRYTAISANVEATGVPHPTRPPQGAGALPPKKPLHQGSRGLKTKTTKAKNLRKSGQ